MKNQAEDEDNNKSSDTQMNPSKLHAAGTAIVASIFDIVTAAAWSPSHISQLLVINVGASVILLIACESFSFNTDNPRKHLLSQGSSAKSGQCGPSAGCSRPNR